MAEFLTTSGTSYHIEKIIINASKHLTLVSPYLQISKTLFERLKDCSNKGVRIIIIYGKDELKPNEKNSLAELKNVTLFYFENLHAKCYFNENQMVITSMNMYEFSEKNNREMGVYLTKENDSKLFNQASDETKSIIGSSDEISLQKAERKIPKTKESNSKKSKKPKRGYCIRCEERIKYDIEKPYCLSCFSSWSKYENTEYEEDFCHGCGQFEETTMEKPVCYPCFKKYEK